MRQILLGLVVFVPYSIHAGIDYQDFKNRGLTFHPEIQEQLNAINDDIQKSKMRDLYLQMFGLGHIEGKASAEGENFLHSFQCATHGLKGVLEPTFYKYAEMTITPEAKMNCKARDIPKDILKAITDNDDWVRMYNPTKISKKKTTVDSKESTVFLNPHDATASPDEYKASIETSFNTWCGLLNSTFDRNVMLLPLYDLQVALKKFQAKNEANANYKTIMDVTVRFAASMARSYKMMCALHHKLGNILQSHAQKNPTLSFLEVLFNFAPNWFMTHEQFDFLNILRRIIPNDLKSLDYVNIQNTQNQWVILPYDHSEDCGRLIMKKLSPTPDSVTTAITIIPEKATIKE